MGPYCKFCQQRCFVHFPKGTPREVLKAYGSSTIIATCSAGQRFEKDKVDFCYDDIKEMITPSPQATIQAPPGLGIDALSWWHKRASEVLGQPVTILTA